MTKKSMEAPRRITFISVAEPIGIRSTRNVLHLRRDVIAELTDESSVHAAQIRDDWLKLRMDSAYRSLGESGIKSAPTKPAPN